MRESGCCEREWMLCERVDAVRESGCCEREWPQRFEGNPQVDTLATRFINQLPICVSLVSDPLLLEYHALGMDWMGLTLRFRTSSPPYWLLTVQGFNDCPDFSGKYGC